MHRAHSVVEIHLACLRPLSVPDTAKKWMDGWMIDRYIDTYIEDRYIDR